MARCDFECFECKHPDCILTDKEASKGYMVYKPKLTEEQRKEKMRLAKRKSRERIKLRQMQESIT